MNNKLGNYLVGIASLAVLSYVLYDCLLLKRAYEKRQNNNDSKITIKTNNKNVSQIITNNTEISKNLEERL